MSQTSAKYPICSSTIPNYQFYCQVECQIQAIYLHYNLTKWSSKRPLYNCRSKGSCWIDTASCVADLWNISGEIPLVSLAVHQQITYKLDLQPVHPTSIHCIRPQQDRESIYQINEGGGETFWYTHSSKVSQPYRQSYRKRCKSTNVTSFVSDCKHA